MNSEKREKKVIWGFVDKLQYCWVPKNGLPKNGQAGISPKNKNDPGWKMS